MNDVGVQAIPQSQRDAWIALCERFHLDWEFVDLGEVVGLQDGAVVLRISSAKNPAGMLIFPNGTKIMKFADRLASAGFGYSVVSAPASANAQDITASGQILSDWGLI